MGKTIITRCSVEKCGNKRKANGWCNKHYMRYLRHGNISTTLVELHGMKNTKAYSSWQSMKKRCLNPREHSYIRYGGRGITICDEWKESFVFFYEDMGERPFGTTLERIDNNGNYEPSNCKWATKTEQARNTRTRRDNTTGITGVSWYKPYSKYVAQIRVNGKRINLGYYKTLEEASAARKNGEAKFWA